VLENGLLRKIFGSKRNIATGHCREIHYWELKKSLIATKHYFGNQIDSNVRGGECSTYGGEKRCIQGFGGET
jgi:hypothetical protein